MPEVVSADELFRKAIATFGTSKQLIVAIEEMSELSHIICRVLNGRVYQDTLQALAEEIADVEIMLQQLVIAFDLKKEVEKAYMQKIARLFMNLEGKKYSVVYGRVILERE